MQMYTVCHVILVWVPVWRFGFALESCRKNTPLDGGNANKIQSTAGFVYYAEEVYLHLKALLDS